RAAGRRARLRVRRDAVGRRDRAAAGRPVAAQAAQAPAPPGRHGRRRRLGRAAVSDGLSGRIAAALAAREELARSDQLDCYRLLHGWSEGCPGLEIDRYGGAVVIEHRADLAPLLPEVLAALDAHRRFERVVARPRRLGGAPVALRGALEPREVVCEDGLRFAVDLARAGNPGLYLD